MSFASILEERDKDFFEVEERNSRKFEGNNINFYKLYHKSPEHLDYPISKIYLTDFLNKAKISLLNNITKFKDFQESLLASDFFEERTDLRWNLYLVLAVQDLSNIQVQQIESEENYARKLVMRPKEVSDFLQREKLTKNYEDYKAGSPNKEWFKTLHEKDLSKCLSTKFNKKPVEEYIEEKKPYREDSVEFGNNEKEKYKNEKVCKIDKVKSVNLKKFRTHCFRKDTHLTPNLINLITGPNGSGKTSILESIEFSITNDFKRSNFTNANFDRDFHQASIVCTKEAGGQIKLTPEDGSKVRKKREELWYGIGYDPHARDTLNDEFARFNFLDSVAPIRFAMEENIGIKKKFSRILYTSRTLRRENRWKRYKEEFQKQLKNRKNRLKEIKTEKEKLENNLEELKAEKDFNDEKISEGLEKLKLNETNVPQGDKEKRYTAIHETLQVYENDIEEISKISMPRGCSTINDIKETINQINKEIDNIIEKSEEITSLRRKKEIWNSTSHLRNIEAKTERRLEIEELLRDIDSKLNYIWEIDVDWDRIRGIDHSSLGYNSEKLDNLEKVEEEKEKRMAKLETKIEEAKNKFDELESLYTEMKQAGIRYLKKSEGTNECPFCGKEHETYDQLKNSVESGDKEIDFEKVTELEEEKSSLEEELSDTKGKISDEKQKKRDVKFLSELFEKLPKKRLSEEFDVSWKGDTPQEKCLQGLKEILDKKEKLETKKNSLRKERNKLNQDGYILEDIGRLKEIKRSKEFSSFLDSDLDVEGFNTYLTNRIEDIITDLETSMDIAKSLSNVNIEKELDKVVEQKKNSLQKLEKVLNITKKLYEDFELQENTDLQEFCELFHRATKRLELAKEKIKKRREVKEIKSKLKSLSEKIVRLEKQIQRVQGALDHFNNLESLDQRSQRFLEENLNTMERLFKFIHTPKEFSKLRLEEEKGLQAIRNNEKVNIQEMSSGQLASLAMSVQFTLHNVASEAPNFLLMDEPIANLDDLHVFNLLDLLREFALDDHQIFFTTANPEVAKIFRRKFSCFGKDFKEFRLTRNRDNQVKIKAFTKNPGQDEMEEVKL